MEFCRFLLRDNKGYLAYMGKGWMEYPGKLPDDEFTPYLGEGLIKHINRMNVYTTSLAIRRAGSPDIIGMADVYHDGYQNRRVSYYLSKEARGKGYAREAVVAVHDLIERYEHHKVSFAEIKVGNKGSKDLLIDLGFSIVGKFETSRGSSITGQPVLRFIR